MARPSALTLEGQYVEPDATAVSERWLRYRMPGQPPDETDDGGRTWRLPGGAEMCPCTGEEHPAGCSFGGGFIGEQAGEP